MSLPRKTHTARIAAVVTGMSLAIASPVHAQNPGDSAVNQYVEVVPAADGPKAPGVEDKARTSLPVSGKKALQETSTAVAEPLEEIATSSTYGAPEVRAEPKASKSSKPKPRTPTRRPDAGPSTASGEVALATTVSAIASATDERLLGLLLTVLITTLGAVALAVRHVRVD